MNYPKIALLVALGLMATACGNNNKAPNALSPSAPPTAPAPIDTSPTSPPEPTPTSTSPVAPLPGSPPLVPGTIPNNSGVRPPGSSSSVNNAPVSTDNPPPRRRKARIKKEPAPKVIYSDTPVRSKPTSKPAKERDDDDEQVEAKPKKLPVRPNKTVKERDGGSNERVEEKPKKSPAKPAKTPRNDDDDEKVPAAKPAKPADAGVSEKKSNKLVKPAEADVTADKKQNRSAQDSESKN